MDIQKISLQITRVLAGLILGGMFTVVEWVIKYLYGWAYYWFNGSIFFKWPFFILHGILVISLFLLVSYSCLRPLPAHKENLSSRTPHIIFLICIIFVFWYFWIA